MPPSETRYDLKITIHSIRNIPIADIWTFSTDPYIHLAFQSLNARDEDHTITYRSPTHHKDLNPHFAPDTYWHICNVPASGFHIRVDVKDEDPSDKDDGLGHRKLEFRGLGTDWKQAHYTFKLKRRGGGSWRAYACAPIMKQIAKKQGAEGVSGHRPEVDISFEVLGETQNTNSRDGGVYTGGPSYFSKHFSRLVGRMVGIKEKIKPGNGIDDDEPNVDEQNEQARKDKKKQGSAGYKFQANILQLPGPVPPELYHAFVPSKLFIKKLFTGVLLPHFLHNHHRRIFSHDKTTVYGVILDEDSCFSSDTEKLNLADHPDAASAGHRPSTASTAINEDPKHHHSNHHHQKLQLTDRFLEMCGELTESGDLAKEIDTGEDEEVNTGGYLFTYALLLDAQFRWAEVGSGWAKEVGSKHVVLANGAKHVAFAGEFIVRRKPQKKDSSGREKPQFQLVIDNASGTYRPPPEHLETFKKFLNHTFKGMEIMVMGSSGEDGDKMKKMKEDHLKRGRERGEVQGDPETGIEGGDMVTSSSDSSSDEENIAEGRLGRKVKSARRKTAGLNGEGSSHSTGQTSATVAAA